MISSSYKISILYGWKACLTLIIIVKLGFIKQVQVSIYQNYKYIVCLFLIFFYRIRSFYIFFSKKIYKGRKKSNAKLLGICMRRRRVGWGECLVDGEVGGKVGEI